MHVIWKRPDGYLKAEPDDYQSVQIGDDVKIWLHQQDYENFPFRVSGDWQDENLTRRLNFFVNAFKEPDQNWLEMMVDDFEKSKFSNPQEYADDLDEWIHQLAALAKGDQWELYVIGKVLDELKNGLGTARDAFLEKHRSLVGSEPGA